MNGSAIFVATGLPGYPFDGLDEYPSREEARAFARAMAADGYDARVLEELTFFRAQSFRMEDHSDREDGDWLYDRGPEQARQKYYDLQAARE